MSTTANFTTTPRIGMLRIAAGTATRDGLAAAAGDLVFTAGANGSRIDRVELIDSDAVGASAARVVRLWLYDGTTARLLREVEMGAATSSATAKGAQQTVYFINGVVLPTGWTLRATSSTAGAINVIALGGDY